MLSKAHPPQTHFEPILKQFAGFAWILNLFNLGRIIVESGPTQHAPWERVQASSADSESKRRVPASSADSESNRSVEGHV